MTSITTNVRENVMLFDFYLTHGSESYLIQAKKISFVEMGKNAEYSIWGARIHRSKPIIFSEFSEYFR